MDRKYCFLFPQIYLCVIGFIFIGIFFPSQLPWPSLQVSVLLKMDKKGRDRVKIRKCFLRHRTLTWPWMNYFSGEGRESICSWCGLYTYPHDRYAVMVYSWTTQRSMLLNLHFAHQCKDVGDHLKSGNTFFYISLGSVQSWVHFQESNEFMYISRYWVVWTTTTWNNFIVHWKLTNDRWYEIKWCGTNRTAKLERAFAILLYIWVWSTCI